MFQELRLNKHCINLIRHVIAMPGDDIEGREILFSSKQLTAKLLNNSVVRP